jgi:ferredoxin
MCLLGSPDVFAESADDDGTAEVARARQPDERLAELQRTEAGCPEGAISVSTAQ